MAARAPNFVCQNCGAVSPAGRASAKPAASGTRWSRKARGDAPARGLGARAACSSSSRSRGKRTKRRGSASGIAELDRVTGGGFVRGSVLLLGGDPGIGKSTLLIQVAAALARAANRRAVYISGEEAVAQVRLRAERLGLADAAVELAAETAVEDIIATLSQGKPPAPCRHRFDPDDVDADSRIGARHGHAGARRRRRR